MELKNRPNSSKVKSEVRHGTGAAKIFKTKAMASKKIVVASENPASKDLIVNGKNGFLYRNGDVADCAALLNRLLLLSKKEISLIENPEV